MTGDEEDILLVTSEVAVITRLPEGTLRRYRYEGKGPAWFRSGGRKPVYWRSAVRAWLKQQEQESQEQQASEHRKAS